MQKPPNKKQCYSNNKNNTFCDKHLFQHRLAQQFPNLYFSIAEDFCSAPLLWHIHSYCFKTPLNLILNYRTATLIEQREHNYCCFIWSWIPPHCGTKKKKKRTTNNLPHYIQHIYLHTCFAKHMLTYMEIHVQLEHTISCSTQTCQKCYSCVLPGMFVALCRDSGRDWWSSLWM